MNDWLRRLFFVGVLVVSSFSVGAAADVRGSPELTASIADDTVTPGSQTRLRVRLANQGDLRTGERPALNRRATTARGVEVSLSAAGTPIDVRTGTRILGELRRGAAADLGYTVTVAEDASPGTYTVELTATYRYYRRIDTDGGELDYVEATRTEHVRLQVTVADRAAFEVVATDTDVRAGATGTVAVTMRNVGSEAANATRVRLESRTSALSFAGADRTSRFVGNWSPGETRTLSYQATASETAARERHAVTAVATFEDEDGTVRESDPLSFGIVPEAAQTFRVVEVESNVSVGGDGTVTVTLRNTGPVAVTDATVSLASEHRALRLGSGEAVPAGTPASGGDGDAARFVGEWDPGATRVLSYEATAAEDAATRRYPLSVAVAYRDGDGDAATAHPGAVGVVPAPESSTFVVEPVNTTLGIDASNAVRVRVRNVGEKRLTDVRARLTVRAPYESDSPTSYVASLAPGEETTMTFELTTPEDGVATRDAIPLNITAEPPRDERVTYGTYFVPVSITDSGGTVRLLSIVAAGAVALALVAGAWWWYER
ncbi:MAG: CARDB domain-containing protein [Haloquadratum sp.]